jgi:hypothetical protein
VVELVPHDVVERRRDGWRGDPVPDSRVDRHADDLRRGDDEHLRSQTEQTSATAEEDLGRRALPGGRSQASQQLREDRSVPPLLAYVERRRFLQRFVERGIGRAAGFSHDTSLAALPELEALQEPHDRHPLRVG